MLSLGLGSSKRDAGNGHNGNGNTTTNSTSEDYDNRNTARSSDDARAGASVGDQSGSAIRTSSRPPSSASNTSSSLRARSRSPASGASPLFHRRATGSGIGRMESPSQLYTIPSASNIHGSHPGAFVSTLARGVRETLPQSWSLSNL